MYGVHHQPSVSFYYRQQMSCIEAQPTLFRTHYAYKNIRYGQYGCDFYMAMILIPSTLVMVHET